MKKDIHPEYRQVLFVDSSTGYKFVCGSTFRSDKTEIFEGREYTVCYVSVSSSSHPFFTGSKQLIDSEGRVDKFLKRYASKKPVVKPEDGDEAVTHSGKSVVGKKPAAKSKKKK